VTPVPTSNWNLAFDAAGFDLVTLRLLLLLIREHYELYGQWPTADQLRAKLRQPSD
jgi:hypothetical protein